MTDADIQLLREAACAAYYEFGVIHGGPRIATEWGWTPWNPLENDSDTFRLLIDVKLSLESDASIETGFIPGIGGEYELGCVVWLVDRSKVVEVNEVYGASKYTSTRLAIVRAAAECWKLKVKDNTSKYSAANFPEAGYNGF
jgi:hypothetical protein